MWAYTTVSIVTIVGSLVAAIMTSLESERKFNLIPLSNVDVGVYYAVTLVMVLLLIVSVVRFRLVPLTAGEGVGQMYLLLLAAGSIAIVRRVNEGDRAPLPLHIQAWGAPIIFVVSIITTIILSRS